MKIAKTVPHTRYNIVSGALSTISPSKRENPSKLETPTDAFVYYSVGIEKGYVIHDSSVYELSCGKTTGIRFEFLCDAFTIPKLHGKISYRVH